jgi:hypothetical protein
MANQYVFLPWLRRGLAKQITESDPLTGTASNTQRQSVQVSVKIMADDAERASVLQEVALLDSGDIVGINRSAIVKTEPAAGTKNFEPNFFPYIEFYEEDFLWRYSPAKAANDLRLRPWLSLVVLQENEFEYVNGRSTATSRTIRILREPVSDLFPPPSQIWAWAHVQVNDGNLLANELANPNLRNQRIADSLKANPNLGVSRLLCPRKLKSSTSYFAFVVPSFERGRLAGLGGKKNEIEAAGKFEPSWDGAGNAKNIFPVYYEWNFQTGTEDFEALAKKITPKDLGGTDVGRLWMDVSNINYGNLFDYKGNLEPQKPERKGFLPFEGALRLVGTPTPNMTQRTGDPEKEFVTNFSRLINLGVQYRQKTKAELQWSVSALGRENDDPLLVPPIYGKWYTAADGNATVNPELPENWLEQLNLDPAMRVAAGLGAEVIREHQEELMSRSWEQLADHRRKLNLEISRLRFSQEVTKATFAKHFAGQMNASDQGTSNLLALTHSIHSVVKSEQADLSITGRLSGSRTDTAFTQPVFRRITRFNGPVIKRVATQSSVSSAVMSGRIQFVVLCSIVISDPPFLNFSSRMVEKIDPAAFVFQPGPWPNTALNLHQPNWFGDRLEIFLVDREKFPLMLKDVFEGMKKPLMLVPPASNLQTLSENVATRIIPSNSFQNQFKALIPVNAPLAVAEGEVIAPNTFNPFFSEAMFERLGKLRPELFIPNLDKIEPDSFLLLKANSAFIESYMVGLNHEMASEYLWRGFPADMNATFFRQFWDVRDSDTSNIDKSDIKPVRFWTTTNNLGKNGPPGSVQDPLVFVIKSELVKKYPNLVVYAHEAMLNNDGTRVPNAALTPKLPIFLSHLYPDYLFAGFDLTKEQVLGQEQTNKAGWYFVIAERPGEMHFGLDQNRKEGKPFATWNDLAWTDLPVDINYLDLDRHYPPAPVNKKGLEWGKGENPVTTDPVGGTGDAGQMAAILQQRPVQIFIHASMLVK